MKLTLKIWRQKNPNEKGAFVRYPVDDVDPEMSILECLDVLNESLILKGEMPVAFEHDCREGICGSCGFVINGVPHGPERATTACQLTMRHFKEGDELTLEPWRANAFPLVKDLVVNRRAFDHIIEAGGAALQGGVIKTLGITVFQVALLINQLAQLDEHRARRRRRRMREREKGRVAAAGAER